MTKEDILKRLTQNFSGAKIDVQDLTGSSNHYSVLIISDYFIDMPFIKSNSMYHVPSLRCLMNSV